MGQSTGALKNKLDAIHDLDLALRAKRTMTAADDEEINPTLDALAAEAGNVEAQIAADTDPTLPGPDAADAQALQDAILSAEKVIRRNGSIKALVKAATTLISTLNG
jgi:hypothetical protein